jgi:hypothetical protein
MANSNSSLIAESCAWVYIRFLVGIFSWSVDSIFFHLPDCWLVVSMHPEGPATGHLNTGFLGFPLSVSKCWDASQVPGCYCKRKRTYATVFQQVLSQKYPWIRVITVLETLLHLFVCGFLRICQKLIEYTALHDMMINELERTWKEAVRAYFRYCPGICLHGLKKTMEISGLRS